MVFSNIRFIDSGVAESGDGLTPSTPMKNIPAYDNFTDDCVYIFKRYPSIARTSTLISPSNLTGNEDSLEWLVTESDRYSAQYSAYRAFDGFYDNDYCYKSAANTNFPHTITLRNRNKRICVKSYAIRTKYNSSNSENYNPQEWVLEGSDDGSVWSTIDDKTGDKGISWPTTDYGRKFFTVPQNVNSYYYHRIRFISGNHSFNLAIGEIEYFDNVYIEENYYTLPVFGALKTGITNFAFIGCPKEGDMFWDILSNENKTALIDAGWTSDNYDYATILCDTVNSVNFAVSSKCNFYANGIDFLRRSDATNFDTSQTSGTNRNMFYFTGGNNIIDIRKCRFSEWGVNLDEETYLEARPGMKSCAYLYCTGFVDSFRFCENVINYIPQTYGEDRYAYDGFSFTGGMAGAAINNNRFYMTKSDNTTWISGNNTSTNSKYARTCFYINYSSYGAAFWQNSRFICFNNNTMTLRLNDYKNLNCWVYFPRMDKIEFVGNKVIAGRDMGVYDYKRMNMPLYQSSFIYLGDGNYCTDYLIRDFYANVPFMWGIYSCAFLSLNFRQENGPSGYDRIGYERGSKQNIIDNITIILGEGPEINEIDSEDWSRLNTWINNSSNIPLHIQGMHTYNNNSYYWYCNQGNTAKNISVSYPWGIGVYVRCMYMEIESLRGGISLGDCCYVKIKNMTVKKALSRTFSFEPTSSQYAEVDNLYIEDTSGANYVSFLSNNRLNFRLVINKTNHPITTNSYVISSDTNCYNESMIIQKDIGENHAFMLKSLNKFIESCNIKYNGVETLKMFGLYNHDRSLKLIDTGDSGLCSKRLAPGRYKLRLNMSFYGEDLVSSTVTSPTTDRKNVLSLSNFVIGIKTKNGEYSIPDKVSLGTDGTWSSDLVTPFYQEYYVDVYEEQDIFATIERFNVYSTGFNSSNITSAIFLSPIIEATKIGDVGISNSNSNSNSAFIGE